MQCKLFPNVHKIGKRKCKWRLFPSTGASWCRSLCGGGGFIYSLKAGSNVLFFLLLQHLFTLSRAWTDPSRFWLTQRLNGLLWLIVVFGWDIFLILVHSSYFKGSLCVIIVICVVDGSCLHQHDTNCCCMGEMCVCRKICGQRPCSSVCSTLKNAVTPSPPSWSHSNSPFTSFPYT